MTMDTRIHTSLHCLLLSTAMAATVTVQAAQPFPDNLVPGELVKLVSGYDFFRTLPDDFPLVPLPSGMGLQLIGSTSSVLDEQLLLLNPGDNQQVLDAIKDAYIAAGWHEVTVPSSIYYVNPQVQLCSDTKGTLYLSTTSGGDDENQVHVRYQRNISALNNGLGCSEAEAWKQSGYDGGITSYFLQQMPVLAPPGQAVSTPYGVYYMQPAISVSRLQPVFASSTAVSSSSSNSTNTLEYEAAYTVSTEQYSRSGLQAEYAGQLQDQGWAADGSSQGGLSSMSTWFKIVQGPEVPGVDTSAYQSVNLLVILTITQVSREQNKVVVRMTTIQDDVLAP